MLSWSWKPTTYIYLFSRNIFLMKNFVQFNPRNPPLLPTSYFWRVCLLPKQQAFAWIFNFACFSKITIILWFMFIKNCIFSVNPVCLIHETHPFYPLHISVNLHFPHLHSHYFLTPHHFSHHIILTFNLFFPHFYLYKNKQFWSNILQRKSQYVSLGLYVYKKDKCFFVYYKRWKR